jgi:hypothetical protein
VLRRLTIRGFDVPRLLTHHSAAACANKRLNHRLRRRGCVGGVKSCNHTFRSRRSCSAPPAAPQVLPVPTAYSLARRSRCGFSPHLAHKAETPSPRTAPPSAAPLKSRWPSEDKGGRESFLTGPGRSCRTDENLSSHIFKDWGTGRIDSRPLSCCSTLLEEFRGLCRFS